MPTFVIWAVGLLIMLGIASIYLLVVSYAFTISKVSGIIAILGSLLGWFCWLLWFVL